MDHVTTTPVTNDSPNASRKAYETPTLTDFGSVAEVTQGTANPSGADSGYYS